MALNTHIFQPRPGLFDFVLFCFSQPSTFLRGHNRPNDNGEATHLWTLTGPSRTPRVEDEGPGKHPAWNPNSQRRVFLLPKSPKPTQGPTRSLFITKLEGPVFTKVGLGSTEGSYSHGHIDLNTLEQPTATGTPAWKHGDHTCPRSRAAKDACDL